LCAYLEYKEAIDNIKIECKSNSGLFCKALMCTQKNSIYTSEEISQAAKTPHTKFVAVLHLIGMVHKLERRFSFSNEAQQIITKYYNCINQTNKQNSANFLDPFLT